MWIRVFLFILAAGWIPYGIYCLLFPEALAGIAGIEATKASAVTELRAMYGGMQIAVGLAALLGGLKTIALDKALFVQLIALAGLGSARLVGALASSDWSAYTVGALVVEWLFVVLCIAAMRGQPAAQGA